MKTGKLLLILTLIITISALLLTGCGGRQEPPEPTPEPTPVPTPTPFPEPEMTAGKDAVTMNAVELASGSFEKDGVLYVKLSEASEALGNPMVHVAESEEFSFPWRKSEVKLTAGSIVLNYNGSDRTMEAPAIWFNNGEDLYVPVYSFCNGAEIGTYYDEELARLYCSPETGSWELPGGYNVPVMMYHGVGWGNEEASLFVDTAEMERQIKFLLHFGFTPIWFEDLWHVEDYERPIILTYDDGWKNTYENLLPLLEQYDIKITECVVPSFTDQSPQHLSSEELRAMADSGHVSIQSHTYTHDYLIALTKEEQEWQMSESKLWITRFTGREPVMLCYPTGYCDENTLNLLPNYYRFGLRMVGECWNTSASTDQIYRYYPQRSTSLYEYANWLIEIYPELADEISAENYQFY